MQLLFFSLHLHHTERSTSQPCQNQEAIMPQSAQPDSMPMNHFPSRYTQSPQPATTPNTISHTHSLPKGPTTIKHDLNIPNTIIPSTHPFAPNPPNSNPLSGLSYPPAQLTSYITQTIHITPNSIPANTLCKC